MEFSFSPPALESLFELTKLTATAEEPYGDERRF